MYIVHTISRIFFLYFRLSVIIIILENRNLHTLEEDIHDWHPDLKAKLTPDDKCWKNETFSILEKCDLCSGKITGRVGVKIRKFKVDFKTGGT